MPNWYEKLKNSVISTQQPNAPAAELMPEVKELKQRYHPQNKDQAAFIKNKLSNYRQNYTTMMNDIAYTLWPTPTVFALYRYVPWYFGYLAAASALVAELLFFNPMTIIPDLATRYPNHFKELRELTAIADWMKNQGLSVTHEPLFLELMNEIAPLIPLAKIPYWQLNDSQLKEVNPKYLEVLFQYPHRLTYPNVFAKNDDGADLRKIAAENASLLNATIRYRFFGLSTGQDFENLKETGTKVYHSLPKLG